MKLICPNCFKSVSVPEDAAGTAVNCPECGRSFPAPARYNPVVAAAPVPAVPPTPVPPAPITPEPTPMSSIPAPPPGYVPPAPASTALEPPLPAPPPVPPVPAGYTQSRGVTLSPTLTAWLPAICLSAILILTLFPWVGSYVSGHAVYAQGPWRSLFRSVDRSFELEPLLKDLPPVLDRVDRDWLMFPYLLGLTLAVVLAWAERSVANLDRTRMPPALRWVTTVWPYRLPLLAGLAVLLLVLLVAQLANGFGLERAMRSAVAEKFEPQRKEVGSSQSKQATIDFYENQELKKYGLEHTTWLYLALLLHVVVVLAVVARIGLDARGTKPPPRIVVQY